MQIVAHHVGDLAYGVFAAPGAPRACIAYDAAPSHLPPAAFIEMQSGPRAPVVASDANTALEVAAAGLGWAVLPEVVAAADPRLVRIAPACPPPPRPVRLLSHVSLRGLAGVAAVGRWLTDPDWSGRPGAGPG